MLLLRTRNLLLLRQASSIAPGIETIGGINHQTATKQKRRENPVPASQFSRLATFGGAAVNIGARVLGRSVKQSIFGRDAAEKESTSVLGSAEITKIVEVLCTVRGAAMKVGQILSLQDDSVISPQVRSIFEKVRDSADCMPYWQAEKVLSTELGSDWETNFLSFDKVPFAAASIGQVHQAILPSGKLVAVKVQYPGVEQSITSDIKNLTAMIKMWNIVPKGLYIENMMRVVKRELFCEVNYFREAKCSKHFSQLLAQSPEMSLFYVPKVVDHLSTRRVITSELIQGVSIDKMDKDQSVRNKVGTAIMQLLLNEVFVYRFMQTDPNFANFIYNNLTGKIQLLDFGAARSFGKPFIDCYMRVVMAAAEGNRQKVLEKSCEMGFLTGYETTSMEDAHVDSIMILGEILRVPNFDYGKQMATRKVSNLVPVMARERLAPPPDESYSLHRKFAGVFLLLSHLGSVAPCRAQFLKILEDYKFDPVSYNIATMPVDDGNTGLHD